MSFQENLRKYREAAGFTQSKDFASKIGIPYSTYTGYENQGREPKYDLLSKIAAALGVTTDELLGYAPKDTDWLTAKLKPALGRTSFSVEGIDENGNISLAYTNKDDAKTEHFIFSNDYLRAIFEKQEELADKAKGIRLRELLEAKLFQEIFIRTILS